MTIATKKFKMPRAEGKLWLFLLISIATIAITASIFGIIWGVVTAVIIGLTFPLYCYDKVPAFYAQATEDVEGNLGVWLPGLNFFNPLQFIKPTGPPTDLQAEVHLSVVDSYQSLYDGMVFVKYTMSLRIDIFGDDPKGAILKYLSFEPGSVETLGRSIASGLISDWFATNTRVFEQKKQNITNEVFGVHGHHPDKINDYTEIHGVHFHINIEDVDPDEQVKKAKAAAKQASEAAVAIRILMNEAGMSQTDAEKFYKLATLPQVTETIHTVKLDASGLEKLQNFSVLGGLGGGGKK